MPRLTFAKEMPLDQIWRFLKLPNLGIEVLVIVTWLGAAVLNPGYDGALPWPELLMLGGMVACCAGTLWARGFATWRLALIAFYFFDIIAFRLQIEAIGERGAIWALVVALIINFGTAILLARLLDYLMVVAFSWLVLCYGMVPILIAPDMMPLYYVLVSGVVCGGAAINFTFMRLLTNVLQLKEHYRIQAETDSLTGIANRRVLLSELQLACAKPDPRGAWFVMLDIDNFKRINDEFGHDRGDEVLKSLAEQFRCCCHRSHYGRLGGEEFGIVFNGCTQQEVVDALKCLFEGTRQAALAFSFSAGLAHLHVDFTASETLVHADQQLYLAKRAGKSCLFAGNALLYQG